MKLYIKIFDKDKKEKASASGEDNIYLDWRGEYEPGDTIVMESESPAFVVAQPEDSMPKTIGYLVARYEMEVPFEEKKLGHAPQSFLGELHLLSLRVAHEFEINEYRNLALNPFDCHGNSGFFPHASANVETRGESVFAARNAINGNTANSSHGRYPYESWGINQRDDAEIKIDFGRSVLVDRAIITLRADFPHDNWWQHATLQFSDGTTQALSFVKTHLPQEFTIERKKVEWVIMKDMIKDPTDPAPFPALTQIELWGNEYK